MPLDDALTTTFGTQASFKDLILHSSTQRNSILLINNPHQLHSQPHTHLFSLSPLALTDQLTITVANGETTPSYATFLLLRLSSTTSIIFKAYVCPILSPALSDKLVLGKPTLATLRYSLTPTSETVLVQDKVVSLLCLKVPEPSVNPALNSPLSESSASAPAVSIRLASADSQKLLEELLAQAKAPYHPKYKDGFDFSKYVPPYLTKGAPLSEYLTEAVEQGTLSPYRPPPSQMDEPVLAVPLFPLLKPNDTYRWVLDLRKVNQVLIYPNNTFFNTTMILSDVSRFHLFGSIDLKNAFHQIAMVSDPPLVVTTSQGLFRVEKLPFGLASATQVFNSRLQPALAAVRLVVSERFGYIHGVDYLLNTYVDDITIGANSSEILQHVWDTTLSIFQALEFQINKEKSKLGMTEIKLLGKVISHNRVLPDPEKVTQIQNWELPASKKQVLSFLGLLNFLRPHLVRYSELVAPLYDQLKQTSLDSSVIASAFAAIKTAMLELPTLSCYDFAKPLYIFSDASHHHSGAIAFQQLGSNKRLSPVLFFSKKFTPAEINYSASERELLAITQLLLSDPLIRLFPRLLVFTDHMPLINILDGSALTEPTTRLIRLFSKILHLRPELHYVEGSKNISDAISRFTDRPESDVLPLLYKANLFPTPANTASMSMNSLLSQLPLIDPPAAELFAALEFDAAADPLEDHLPVDLVVPDPVTSPGALQSTELDFLLLWFDSARANRTLLPPAWLDFIDQFIVFDSKNATLYIRVDESLAAKGYSLNSLILYQPDMAALALLERYHSLFHGSPRLLSHYFVSNNWFTPHLQLLATDIIRYCSRCELFRTWPSLVTELAPRRSFLQVRWST